MEPIFEWDPEKAADNLKKHGVGFEEAATVFGDPLARLIDDPEHSESEPRYVLFGRSEVDRLLASGHAHGPRRCDPPDQRPRNDAQGEKAV